MDPAGLRGARRGEGVRETELTATEEEAETSERGGAERTAREGGTEAAIARTETIEEAETGKERETGKTEGTETEKEVTGGREMDRGMTEEDPGMKEGIETETEMTEGTETEMTGGAKRENKTRKETEEGKMDVFFLLCSLPPSLPPSLPGFLPDRLFSSAVVLLLLCPLAFFLPRSPWSSLSSPQSVFPGLLSFRNFRLFRLLALNFTPEGLKSRLGKNREAESSSPLSVTPYRAAH
mmetsp:Transcript_40505/g.79853  ORF Transcript_40505/g.79853 Transcript_40505/m.79853 type:complete len:238 (+) Transcript_40505:446-1159(+)